MRKSLLFWLAPWLAIGLGACSTFQPPWLPSKPLKMDAAKSCAQWRWIGISRTGSQCPKIPRWTVSPLFPGLSSVDERERVYESYSREAGDRNAFPDAKLIAELQRFCVYQADKWLPPPPPVSKDLVRVDQDCAALALSGEPGEAIPDGKQFLSRFREQTGKKTFPIPSSRQVRLAFLDTEPTGEEVSDRRGRSPHGYTLIKLGQDLICNGEDCAVRVTSRLALPIRSFDAKHPGASEIDEEYGGYMGFQGYVAEAIQKEVDAWREERRYGKEKHLVLNLSLAWDGNLFGGFDEESVSEMRAGNQAVYRALQYAASFDVLVLAAAGNQKGEPCDNSGPLLPAAWESAATREENCGERRKTPLVYAVGGVRSNGDPLINFRKRGMPRRAAYGENAPVFPIEPNRPPGLLTGSSVSTAVASSIAAAVWASFPDHSSKEIMDLLDASGDPLRFDADFWFDVNGSPAPPQARRLSLCKALQAAHDQWGPPAQFDCETWELGTVKSLYEPEKWVPDSCQPWMFPQPETPPCLSCGPPNWQN